MTVFRLDVTLKDAYTRLSRKTYYTEDISAADVGAEYLIADTSATALLVDLAAISEAEVLRYTLGREVAYTDSVVAEANVDEGLTMTVEKVDGFYGTLKVPAPVNSIFNADGSLDVIDALPVAYIANFAVGGGFTFSDGENLVALVKGKLDR